MDPRFDEYGPYSVTSDGRIFGQTPIDRPLSREKAAAETVAERYVRIRQVERLRKIASQPISWNAIDNACGLTDLRQIQSALASIEMPDLASPTDLSNLAKLTTFAFDEGVFFPTSGHIQSSMETRFGHFFQSLGVSDLIISDEFRLNEQKLAVATLLHEEPLECAMAANDRGKFGITRICAVDADIECVADNGSFYTKLTMAMELKGRAHTELFEGFWDEGGSW
jgi:hypothetical protein